MLQKERRIEHPIIYTGFVVIAGLGVGFGGNAAGGMGAPTQYEANTEIGACKDALPQFAGQVVTWEQLPQPCQGFADTFKRNEGEDRIIQPFDQANLEIVKPKPTTYVLPQADKIEDWRITQQQRFAIKADDLDRRLNTKSAVAGLLGSMFVAGAIALGKKF